MTTVEEILKAKRPERLTERAKAAFAAQKQREEDELTAEKERLFDDTYVWLGETLGLSEPELADVPFESGIYNNVRAMVEFAVDGIRFRSRYTLRKVHEIDRSGTKEVINDWFLIVEAQPFTTTWHEIDSLAKLGSVLK